MPNFLAAISDSAAKGCLVKPVLLNVLTGSERFRFRIDAERPRERVPDGMFHPSTHPGLTVPQLVAYLKAPAVRPALRDYISVMSTTMGTIMGDLAQQSLMRAGVAIPRGAYPCPACGLKGPKCKEHGAAHPPTRSRGHLDSVLGFSPEHIKAAMAVLLPSVLQPSPVPAGMCPGIQALPAGLLENLYGYDHKTAMTMSLKDVPEMDEQYFREKQPKYWWQAQEYMRLTGLRKFIILIQGLGNPWTMKEFHLPYDPAAGAVIEANYRTAIAAAGLS